MYISGVIKNKSVMEQHYCNNCTKLIFIKLNTKSMFYVKPTILPDKNGYYYCNEYKKRLCYLDNINYKNIIPVNKCKFVRN